jgi:hypothetical protein
MKIPGRERLFFQAAINGIFLRTALDCDFFVEKYMKISYNI